MPTHRYHCLACNETFDLEGDMKEHQSALPKCPECKNANVIRVLTPKFVETSKKG